MVTGHAQEVGIQLWSLSEICSSNLWVWLFAMLTRVGIAAKKQQKKQQLKTKTQFCAAQLPAEQFLFPIFHSA